MNLEAVKWKIAAAKSWSTMGTSPILHFNIINLLYSIVNIILNLFHHISSLLLTLIIKITKTCLIMAMVELGLEMVRGRFYFVPRVLNLCYKVW